MNIQTKIDLGAEVVDKVTGFKGTVTGISVFLNGCARVLVQPKCAEDGALKDPSWFDEPQLEVVDVRSELEDKQRKTGGPMPSTPTRPTGPRR